MYLNRDTHKRDVVHQFRDGNKFADCHDLIVCNLARPAQCDHFEAGFLTLQKQSTVQFLQELLQVY